jgi:hypothetical protein
MSEESEAAMARSREEIRAYDRQRKRIEKERAAARADPRQMSLEVDVPPTRRQWREIERQEREFHADVRSFMAKGMSFDEAWVAAGGMVFSKDRSPEEANDNMTLREQLEESVLETSHEQEEE